MQRIYALNDADQRKLRFLYHQSAIDNRYSVIGDYSRPVADWKFYPHTENLEPFPSLEQRMAWFQKFAAPLSVDAVRHCISGRLKAEDITHLITVSCTGMSAPGLDLQLMDLLDLPKSIYRTSVNFMGCYAAIHALKIADAIASQDKAAKILLVCTELCTLHFQREPTTDSMASSLLFSDGSAAALVVHEETPGRGLWLDKFYAEVLPKGKKDMAWEISSTGFQMTLSGYVPDLIDADFAPLVKRALELAELNQNDIQYWCIHPGGKKILDNIHKKLQLGNGDLKESYEVLRQYGNMSSSTILFVLRRIMQQLNYAAANNEKSHVLGAAFGPGLTMETFIAHASA